MTELSTPAAPPARSRIPMRRMAWKSGMLATTVLMGLVLAGTGVLQYRLARQDGARITQAQVMMMMAGVQRHLRGRGGSPAEADLLFAELAPKGVNAVTVYGRGSIPVLAFGQPKVPFTFPARPPADQGHPPVHVRFVAEGTLAHATVPFPPPRRRAGRPGLEAGQGRVVQVELVPAQAIALRNRAFTFMLVNLSAALVLLTVAGVFWRMARRQEAVAAQLQRDRQLKTLGQMSAVLGHEIRNTITSMKGHAQLLAEKLQNVEDKAGAERIAADVAHLHTVASQILAFARTKELQKTKVYLDDLADAAITLAGADPVELEIRGEQPAWVLDRHKMEQVIVNLLSNARDAGGQEPVRMEIEAGQRLRIRVIDRGEGIPQELTQRVFEPFFTTRARGTGLGLAFARQVVEAHGGTLTCATANEGGAVFTVDVPPCQEET